MSNITAYPLITSVEDSDLLIVSDTSLDNNPTRSMSMSQVKAYIDAAANTDSTIRLEFTMGVDGSGNLYRSVHKNTTGATTLVLATTGTGDYTLTADTNIFNTNIYETFITVMNPNRVNNAAGTSALPQPTVARVKASNILGIEVFSNNIGGDVGGPANLPSGGYAMAVQVQIYLKPQ